MNVYILVNPSTKDTAFIMERTPKALWKLAITTEWFGTVVTQKQLYDKGWRAVPAILTPLDRTKK